MSTINKIAEYAHGNANNAFVDSNFVRGGGREVLNLSALYGLTNKSDQLKENVTTVWVINESAFYVLTDDANIGNANGWTELSSIIGGSGVTSVNGDIGPTVVLDADDISEAATSPTNLYYTSTRFDNSFSAKDTDNLSEGVSNLYYTDTRFDSRFNVSSVTGLSDVSSAGSGQIITPQERTSISTNQTAIAALGTELTATQTGAGLNATGTYSQNTGANYIASVASLNAADVALDTQIKTNETNISSINTTINGLNTDDIPEASTNPTNVYYTEARFNSSFGGKTTDDLAEGSNLYYTDARFDARLSLKSTDDLSEGASNLYFPGFGTTAGRALEGNTSLFDGDYNNLSNIPSTFTPSAHNQAWTTITGTPTTIAGYGITDAFDGDYNNLTNTPSLATVATSGSYTDLSNTPTLATVATSGSYTDLSNTPTTITSQQSTNIANNTTHSAITSGNPHGTSITNLVGVPSTLGSYKNVLTVDLNGTALEYSDLIEEITNEVLDLVNTSSSYTLQSADINGDGIVSVDDLLILLSQFGTSTSTAFTAGWLLDDSNSTIPYTGSTNESDATDSPSDSNTNLLLIETPTNVSAYSPWTITTNTNNETVTISQSNGDSAESVEYSKDLDFIGDVLLEIQQTSNSSSNYYVFLKAVYSYPTASDYTEWHSLGQFSHAEANYDPAGGAGTQKAIFSLSNVENLFDYTSTGTNGSEHPSSVTMSFRYMKSVTEGDGYLRLKYVDFQWRS